MEAEILFGDKKIGADSAAALSANRLTMPQRPNNTSFEIVSGN